ncbi:MAG: menaquinone biosynthesis protein [Bacteroidetes bacterium]|nr:menaquinone biosynthesis protein [Bacteroidota bacterium]
MKTLNISAVSYLNTYPFVYGIQQSGYLQDYHLYLEVPSICAERLKSGEADIALVPAGALPDFRNYHIISDYCLGAVKKVITVLLLSNNPLEKIRKIFLDFDSRTSVRLVQILARSFWKIEPVFERLEPGQAEDSNEKESIVAIGDKTFGIRDRYAYSYDLADEWIKFTGLPFVFAVWISVKPLPEPILSQFNKALQYGIQNIDGVLEFFESRLPKNADCRQYLTENISYIFDKPKHEGLNLFLSYL